jgi:tetratricopeptide (TPR) repeat protein
VISFHELGLAYLQTVRLEKAIDNFKKAVNRSPNHVWPNMSLIWAYNELGHEEDVRKAATEFLKIDHEFSIERDLKGFAHKKFTDSLRKVRLK